MKNERILNNLSQVEDAYIVEASPVSQRGKKRNWTKWVAMAACLCLVTVAAITLPHMDNLRPAQPDDFTTEQFYTLPQAEQLNVRLVEWQSEGFKAVVTDKGTIQYKFLIHFHAG